MNVAQSNDGTTICYGVRLIVTRNLVGVLDPHKLGGQVIQRRDNLRLGRIWQHLRFGLGSVGVTHTIVGGSHQEDHREVGRIMAKGVVHGVKLTHHRRVNGGLLVF